MKWLKRIKPHISDAITEGKIYPVISYEDYEDDEVPVSIDNNGNKFTCYVYTKLELWEVINDEVVEENQTAQLGRNNRR